jgi:hypothetical protein
VAPFLLGLIVSLAALLYKFIVCCRSGASVYPPDVIVGILILANFTLTANLILIVICSS